MTTYKFSGDNVEFTKETITSDYLYSTTNITRTIDVNNHHSYTVTPVQRRLKVRTLRTVPKTGVMLVGWGGNNGSTFTAVVLANKHGLTWETKEGKLAPNYYGSIVKSSTMCLGLLHGDDCHEKVCAPVCELLPFVNPNDLEIDGWDISRADLSDSVKRAKVIDFDLQKKLHPLMKCMRPRPSVYDPSYLSSTQEARADNTIPGTLQEQLDQIRSDIRDFKRKKGLDKVIVMWTASTEKYMDLNPEVESRTDMPLAAIAQNDRNLISPSMLFAVASILEGCIFINGAPQNTIGTCIKTLAEKHNVFVAGDDFKSGQTKVKSALVEFLIGSGIKPVCISSYNHLGNNDGKNLSSPPQFRSKEISKSTVIDEMVESNRVLYDKGEKPDHCIVIKYMPYVGDSKRAIDEYVSEICMHGTNTLMIYNVCEDSLLATPIMLDLILLSELFTRISAKSDSDQEEFHSFQTVLSGLGFLLKAPLTSNKEPVVNGLMAQKSCILNLIRACLGIPPETHMYLEQKFSLN